MSGIEHSNDVLITIREVSVRQQWTVLQLQIGPIGQGVWRAVVSATCPIVGAFRLWEEQMVHRKQCLMMGLGMALCCATSSVSLANDDSVSLEERGSSRRGLLGLRRPATAQPRLRHRRGLFRALAEKTPRESVTARPRTTRPLTTRPLTTVPRWEQSLDRFPLQPRYMGGYPRYIGGFHYRYFSEYGLPPGEMAPWMRLW